VEDRGHGIDNLVHHTAADTRKLSMVLIKDYLLAELIVNVYS